MGTPYAFIYATLFFGCHERTLLLIKYKSNILLYKCQIDDIVLIGLPSLNDNKEWSQFKNHLFIPQVGNRRAKHKNVFPGS